MTKHRGKVQNVLRITIIDEGSTLWYYLAGQKLRSVRSMPHGKPENCNGIHFPGCRGF